jgi:hypothetical protein
MKNEVCEMWVFEPFGDSDERNGRMTHLPLFQRPWFPPLFWFGVGCALGGLCLVVGFVCWGRS